MIESTSRLCLFFTSPSILTVHGRVLKSMFLARPARAPFLSPYQRACWRGALACTEISRHGRGRWKIPPPRYSRRSTCGPLSEHFQVSADKSLPLKHEYFLFGDQEDRCAAGRNRNCISDRLFATVRCGAGLQSLHGGEMDLCNAMKRWCPLRGTDYFARHNFGLAGKLLDGHRHMFAVIDSFECFDVLRTRVKYY